MLITVSLLTSSLIGFPYVDGIRLNLLEGSGGGEAEPESRCRQMLYGRELCRFPKLTGPIPFLFQLASFFFFVHPVLERSRELPLGRGKAGSDGS
jgi:hypothetical protein